MEWQDKLKSLVLSTIVRDIPKAFWSDFRALARQVYLEAFHEVATAQNVIGVQRLDKLYQDRHFKMEHLLQTLAGKHGFAVSPTIISENSRQIVYAVRGGIALQQVYVPTIGEMPKAARYRERFAGMMNLSAISRLDLGDEPPEVLVGKDFYGILAHNPAGKRFAEEEQKLSMIQLCIPTSDCKDWAIELTIEEILVAYEITSSRKKATREMRWKKNVKKKEEDGK